MNPVYSGDYTYEGRTRIYHRPWRPGSTFSGRVSWFGGPNDSMDNGSADAHNGIAFPSTATRGGWFAVTFPNGRTLIRRQIDYGPADWVGGGNRIADVNFNMLRDAGYTESNFPTDAEVRVTYLGKGTLPSDLRNLLGRNSQFMQVGFNPFDLLNRGGLGGIDTDPTPNDPGTAAGDAADALGGIAGDVGGAFGDVGSAVGDMANWVGKLFGMLTDISFWIRVGQAVAGVILIKMGLTELGKTSGAAGAAVRTMNNAPRRAAAAAAGAAPQGRLVRNLKRARR